MVPKESLRSYTKGTSDEVWRKGQGRAPLSNLCCERLRERAEAVSHRLSTIKWEGEHRGRYFELSAWLPRDQVDLQIAPMVQDPKVIAVCLGIQLHFPGTGEELDFREKHPGLGLHAPQGTLQQC